KTHPAPSVRNSWAAPVPSNTGDGSVDRICFDGRALAYRRRVMRTEGDMVAEEVHMWLASLFPIGSMKSELCQGRLAGSAYRDSRRGPVSPMGPDRAPR